MRWPATRSTPTATSSTSADGAAILALRDRYEAGAWAGPDDRRDADTLALPPATPPPPIADPPARACRDCGDVIGPHGDRCVRCAGLTPARPQRVCELCCGVIGPDVAGDICPRCSAQMGGGDPGDEWAW
jgi:hypothetical protein